MNNLKVNSSKNILSGEWKEAWIIAFFVAAGSQFYVDAFANGFIIAFSVVIFPIFLYLYRERSIFKLCMITSIFSPFFRGLVLTFHGASFRLAMATVYPECFFYLSYSFIFYIGYHIRQLDSRTEDIYRLTSIVFACDFFSNIVEFSMREGIDRLVHETMYYLLTVAMLRTVLVIILIVIINSSENFLLQKENRRRYEQLVMMNSMFKSELYMMSKSVVDIESVMKKSFDLYRQLNGTPEMKEKKNMALEIAKDIHEIKKEYGRLMRGIENAFTPNVREVQMTLRELVRMLCFYIEHGEEVERKSVLFDCIQPYTMDKIVVTYPYQLISILQNLLSNAVEALEVGKPNAQINFQVYEEREDLCFSIRDNGRGMTKEEQEMIFIAGYSTKFDEKTGEINRGLGLIIVKDMVDFFHGSIEVQSKLHEFTEFIVKIPREYI